MKTPRLKILEFMSFNVPGNTIMVFTIAIGAERAYCYCYLGLLLVLVTVTVTVNVTFTVWFSNLMREITNSPEFC